MTLGQLTMSSREPVSHGSPKERTSIPGSSNVKDKWLLATIVIDTFQTYYAGQGAQSRTCVPAVTATALLAVGFDKLISISQNPVTH